MKRFCWRLICNYRIARDDNEWGLLKNIRMAWVWTRVEFDL